MRKPNKGSHARSPHVQVRGLGIDLVHLVRFRKFIKQHRQKAFESLLTREEKENLKIKSISLLKFAKIFAAKEAFFKSLGCSWMGIEGFSKIEIQLLSKNRFQAHSPYFLKSKSMQVDGCFFHAGQSVGAQVILWH